MKIKKLMSKPVGFCRPDDDLAKAVGIMWEKDCGVVPVVDGKKKVIGMVTDRDVAVSVFLQNRPPSEIRAGEVTGGKVIACAPGDRAEKALKLMRKNRVKRLPVVDKKGALAGIVSLSDILLAAEKDKKLRKRILKTLAAIYKPRSIVLTAVEE